MSEELRISRAVETDVPLILHFIRGLAEYERLQHECVATDEKLTATLFGPSPSAEVLIARLGDRPAGFALFFHSYSTFLAQRGLYLEDLFVDPEYRGHGIGRALLAALARIAVDRDCGRLEWAVLDWNAPSIAFYEAMGAFPLGEWTTFRMTGEELAALAATGMAPA